MTVRRVVRFRRACKPPASTLAELTGCSGRGRGRRSGGGRRCEGHGRRGIWTGRRWRLCGRRWRGSRRSASGRRRGPPRRRQRPRLRRPRSLQRSSSPRRAARSWRGLFWQFRGVSVEFPNGVFLALASARLAAALRASANDPPVTSGCPVGGVGSPAAGSRVSVAGGAAFAGAAVVDVPRRPGDVFRGVLHDGRPGAAGPGPRPVLGRALRQPACLLHVRRRRGGVLRGSTATLVPSVSVSSWFVQNCSPASPRRFIAARGVRWWTRRERCRRRAAGDA